MSDVRPLQSPLVTHNTEIHWGKAINHTMKKSLEISPSMTKPYQQLAPMKEQFMKLQMHNLQ